MPGPPPQHPSLRLLRGNPGKRPARRPPEAKQAEACPQPPARLLTRLNRLTEANPIEAFSERTSPAHTELVAILHELASPPTASSMHA